MSARASDADRGSRAAANPPEPVRDADGCHECPIPPTRRAFLRDAALTALGLLVGVGATRSAAAQLPVGFTSPLLARGTRRNYPIPAADGVEIDRENEVILVRWQQAVYAFNLSCPHQNTALRWNDGAHRFQCPKHHSQYQPSGEFIDGRATRGMDRFSITRDGTSVAVDVDAMHKQDEDPAGWTAAVVHLS